LGPGEDPGDHLGPLKGGNANGKVSDVFKRRDEEDGLAHRKSVLPSQASVFERLVSASR